MSEGVYVLLWCIGWIASSAEHVACATDWDFSLNSVLEVSEGETDSLYVPTHQLIKPQELKYYVKHICVTFFQMFNGDARYFLLINFRII